MTPGELAALIVGGTVGLTAWAAIGVNLASGRRGTRRRTRSAVRRRGVALRPAEVIR